MINFLKFIIAGLIFLGFLFLPIDSGAIIGAIIATIIIFFPLNKIIKRIKKEKAETKALEEKKYIETQKEKQKQEEIKFIEEKIIREHQIKTKLKKEELHNCNNCGAAITTNNNGEYCIYCNAKLI